MNQSKKAKDYTGARFLGDCNEEQLKQLAEFRQHVTSLGLQNPPFDDAYLLRFLRARKFDQKKTQLMFDNYIQWRKENDVDNILSYMFTELPQVKNFYPHGYHKTDKMGRPIYIERIGILQLQQLFQITNDQRLMKYYIQSYEILLDRIFPECTKAKGERVEQTLTILDLKGSSLKMASKQVYDFIQLASKIGQDNYPEILGKMFIVNAPMLFSGIWSMIKIWLDEKTRNKITIIGSSYKEELLKLVIYNIYLYKYLQKIDPQNLPEFLGGTCKCDGGNCLEKNIGPWNPSGNMALFPCEASSYVPSGQLMQEEKKDQQEEEEEEEDELEHLKLEQLKNALGDFQLASAQQKAPHNPNKYEQTTQQHHIVSDTPLNTEAGEEHQNEIE